MTTAEKIVIIVGIIIFTICDIGIYALIMKRLRDLEDKYLGVLKMTQDCIDISKQTINTAMNTVKTVKDHIIEDHPTSIDISEREPQIYEPSGITKEDIIKECDSESCSIDDRESLAEFILHHLGAIVKIFDKEGLLLRHVLNNDPNYGGWLLKDFESSGIYIYYLVKCEDGPTIICSRDWTNVYNYKFDENDEVRIIASVEPILKDEELSRKVSENDIYYSGNVLTTSSVMDDILEKMREQYS